MSEVITLCQNLVRYESVEPHITEIFSFIANYLKNCGFEVEEIICSSDNQEKSLPALYAHIGSGKKHLLFNGHLDVVPAGDINKWNYSPFDGKISDGKIFGRGIADMKGGIAAFICAVKEVITQDFSDGKISILLASDEETASVNTTQKALKYLAQKGEKFDFAIVGEPSNPKEIGEEIKIGRRGDIVIRLTSYGTQGHTAYPHLADNPIHHLLDLLHKLTNIKFDDGNDFFAPTNMQITTIDVGNNASNIIPEKAVAQIDIRFNSEQNSEKIINQIKKEINNTQGQFTLETEVIGESFLSPQNHDVMILKKNISDLCQIQPVLSTSGGTSDARFIYKYCPVVEFGLTNATIHKINECERIENIEKLQKIYQAFLVDYFNLKI